MLSAPPLPDVVPQVLAWLCVLVLLAVAMVPIVSEAWHAWRPGQTPCPPERPASRTVVYRPHHQGQVDTRGTQDDGRYDRKRGYSTLEIIDGGRREQ